KALAEWAGQGDNRPRLVAPAAETADKDAWQGKLDKNAKSIVLYFSAQGGADANGAFLWFIPADAKTPSDAHKLRVKDILARLEGLPKDQPKLLIFDAARLPASWPHGMLFNDFARALKELDGEIAKVGGLVVICSSDADERAWSSEEFRSSVFGHFVVEGLKGAAGKQPGERITAAGLFDYVSTEVTRWAFANRDEKQTPILLPANGGRERAEAIELSVVPVGGYTKPALPERPGKVPDDLKAAWETAVDLAGRTPAPDTLDPGKWREYLDLLIRWERLVRLGEDPEPVRARAVVLGEQLKAGPGAADPPCLPVAFPVGRALGVPSAERDLKAFGRLWSPPVGVTRVDEWKKQLGPEAANETARRVVVAEMLIERVLADGPSKSTLETADAVLGVVDVARVGTAEGHYVRMLHRHLDKDNRPPDALLGKAIKLRREAEEVAWVGGAGEKEYPYSEQVYRWIQGRVEAGDEARSKGEDLLFDAEAKSWQKSETDYFTPARQYYAQARDDAKVVTAALNTRDKVLARLPYYARWVAGYRGKLPAAEVERLLGRVEAAARGAHRLATLTAEVPESPAARIVELKALTDQVNADFVAVTGAFDKDVERLSNTVHPSNWHALDTALAVPFIAAKDRVKLIGFVRDVSYQLATKEEQPAGAVGQSLPAQENAKRQGRMALAVLGDNSPDLQAMIATPKPGAWWESLREVGDRLGKRYQGLANESRAAAARAAAAPKFKDAGPHLAEAARLARLADPAAPLSDEPVAADRR
ncbi:MAG TPA: hypothetical protein VKE74_02485, partial [Gemmataceae bacterium]|nr:hypothetical protein [Gemmataceae bacterium]